MKTSKRSVVALACALVFTLAFSASYSDESPQAHLQGFRCESLDVNGTGIGNPAITVILCQIEDGSEPTAQPSWVFKRSWTWLWGLVPQSPSLPTLHHTTPHTPPSSHGTTPRVKP